MTFTSFSYFLFLPVVHIIFQLTADRWRWLVLLFASYGFYASFKAPYLLGVLVTVTGVSYACGLGMAEKVESVRKRYFWSGCFACAATLGVMKYLPLLHSSSTPPFSSAIISIGVSYFAFQAISYLVDIYLEIQEPETHFGRFALFLAFFPKLLQGPIERGSDLLPQLNQPYRFDYNLVRSGLLLFGWGLFKKVAVANRLAVCADQVYNNLHDHTGISLIVGTYAYALQIYYDFSAYTDMARGTGMMFGIHLSENFNRPYLATSVADFWRRWHMSFSRWILDYIFKPLQMGWRNWGKSGTAAALIITFFVSGIWHGPTWGFVVWGLLHGTYLAVSTYYSPYQKRLHKMLRVEKTVWLRCWQVMVTFNLVCVAWIFFRAKTLDDAIYVLTHLGVIDNSTLANLINITSVREGLVLVFLLTLTVSVSCLSKGRSLLEVPLRLRWGIYYCLALAIMVFSRSSESFIYFRF